MTGIRVTEDNHWTFINCRFVWPITWRDYVDPQMVAAAVSLSVLAVTAELLIWFAT